MTMLSGQHVCIAGVLFGSDFCIRPDLKWTVHACRARGLMPGDGLQGDFDSSGSPPPHVEDHRPQGQPMYGRLERAHLRCALERTQAGSVAEGFGCELPVGEKSLYSEACRPIKSIVTIRVAPDSIQLYWDDYRAEPQLRVGFQDGSGMRFVRPYKDLLPVEYMKNNQLDDDVLRRMRRFIDYAEDVFLRIGLSRVWESPHDGRRGYWLQVNGIHTFPDPLFSDWDTPMF